MRKTDCLLVLAAALLLRFGFFIALIGRTGENGLFDPDSFGYWKIAGNLVSHGAFSLSDGEPFAPTAERTPAYPLFLAAVRLAGGGPALAALIQNLLAAGVCLGASALAWRMTGDRLSAAAAGLITALDVPSISMANLILTETLFTLLLVVSLERFAGGLEDRRPRAGLSLAAAGLGLAALCRPIAVFLPLLLATLLFRRQERYKSAFRRAALFLGLYLLFLSPWLLRNAVHFGSPFLSTIGHYNLLYWRAAGVYSLEKGVSLEEARADLEEIAGKDLPAGLGPRERRKREAALGLAVIAEHPLTYGRLHLRSTLNLLFKPLRLNLDRQLGLLKDDSSLEVWGERESRGLLRRLSSGTSAPTMVLVVVQAFMLLFLWPAALFGLWRARPWRDGITLAVLLAALLYFVLLSAGPEAYARFRVPILPLLAALAGIGLSGRGGPR